MTEINSNHFRKLGVIILIISKSDTVRELVASNEYKKALSIVKGFQRGIIKEDLDKIRLAYECLIYPEFYEQIGTDTTTAISEGVEVLKAIYGQSNNRN